MVPERDSKSSDAAPLPGRRRHRAATILFIVGALFAAVWFGSRWWTFGWKFDHQYSLSCWQGEVHLSKSPWQNNGLTADWLHPDSRCWRWRVSTRHDFSTSEGGEWWFASYAGPSPWAPVKVWYLSAVMWPIPALLWGGVVGTLLARKWARRRTRRGICPACCYNLSGLEKGAVCPECGNNPATW